MIMRLQYIIPFAVMLLPLSLTAQEVDVEWYEPDSYRDIQPAEESRERFRARLFDALERDMASHAERWLPAGYTLHMRVTDLDLAGRVMLENFAGYPQQMRIIRPTWYPQMSFDYRLEDAEGSVVKEGSEDLRGSLPGQGRSAQATPRARNTFVHHESIMLQDWFRKTFRDMQEN